MAMINEGLAALIDRGGLYPNLRGTNPGEVLEAFIRALPPIPSVSADELLKAVMEREALMSTGIGGGIALPHPRNPLAGVDSEQFVALGFLDTPVNWNSLDGEKVDALLLIVSSSAKQHLQTLSKITFFCRQKDFCRLLKERAPLEELLCFIKETEKNWN
jgi:PTS system nitrogen regulatory IIA component